MGEPVLFCDRGNPPAARLHIRLDGSQLLLHMLIQPPLLLHIKPGQPVVHHQDDIDVGRGDAALPAKLPGQLRSPSVAVAIGENHIEIICMEHPALQKILYHGRHLVAVNRGHNPNLTRRKFQRIQMDDLRNTDRMHLYLLCSIEAVAGAGEIEQHRIPAFCPFLH